MAKRQRPTLQAKHSNLFAASSARETHRESIPNPGRGDRGGLSVEQVRKGLPIRAMDDLAITLRVERTELAQILGTSLRTLQRKEESSDRLGPAASDRLARISRIHALACHVFGDAAKASMWLTSESRALNEVPLRLLDTDIGTQRVQQELRQIEFGMPF